LAEIEQGTELVSYKKITYYIFETFNSIVFIKKHKDDSVHFEQFDSTEDDPSTVKTQLHNLFPNSKDPEKDLAVLSELFYKQKLETRRLRIRPSWWTNTDWYQPLLCFDVETLGEGKYKLFEVKMVRGGRNKLEELTGNFVEISREKPIFYCGTPPASVLEGKEAKDHKEHPLWRSFLRMTGQDKDVTPTLKTLVMKGIERVKEIPPYLNAMESTAILEDVIRIFDKSGAKWENLISGIRRAIELLGTAIKMSKTMIWYPVRGLHDISDQDELMNENDRHSKMVLLGISCSNSLLIPQNGLDKWILR
jgi:hypothetical protein